MSGTADTSHFGWLCCDRQYRVIIKDRTIAVQLCLTKLLLFLNNGCKYLKCNISAFIKNTRSKINRLPFRKFLPKEIGAHNIQYTKLLRFLNPHKCDMWNPSQNVYCTLIQEGVNSVIFFKPNFEGIALIV